MHRSNTALIISQEMTKSAWMPTASGALEAASWVPGWVGSAASGAQGIGNLIHGNIGSALGNFGIAAAGLVGANTGAKLLGRGAQTFMKAAPTLGKAVGWVPKVTEGARAVGKGLSEVPLLNHIPNAFMPNRNMANWGATNSLVKGPNSVMKNTWHTFSPMASQKNTSTLGHFVQPAIRQTAAGGVSRLVGHNYGEQAIEAGQGAERGYGDLKNFVNGSMARYGAADPGSIGPSNWSLNATGYGGGYGSPTGQPGWQN